MRTSKDLAAVLTTQGLTSDVFRLFMRLKRSSSRVSQNNRTFSTASSKSRPASIRNASSISSKR